MISRKKNMTTHPLITLKKITKTYTNGGESLTVLSIDDLTIMPREWVSIIGPSGSGKTTLLHILGCLDSPTTGSYHLDGVAVADASAQTLARIRNTSIGFVFQKFHLLPTLTAAENIALPLEYAGFSQEEIAQRVQEYASLVELEHRMQHYPHQLSGGQQQRVAIARALVTKPRIILADEPTGNLDSKTGETILTFLKKLHQEQAITIVLITHDRAVAEQGTRVIEICDGAIK
jgi:putative ABC transport system ATP-binding protein